MLLLLFDIVGDVVVEAVYTCGICDVWSYSFYIYAAPTEACGCQKLGQ